MEAILSIKNNFITREACEICSSRKQEILISRFLADKSIRIFLENYYQGRMDLEALATGKYEIVQCKVCDFIWQKYVLNDEYLFKLYEEWISAEESLKKKSVASPEIFLSYANDIANISFFLKKNPSEIRVLDYGMGWGYWCMMAKAFGYHISGFELSESRKSFARKNAIDVISEQEHLNKMSFDYINVYQVLEHLTDLKATLLMLQKCLKSEGLLKISVPNGKRVKRNLLSSKWKPSKGPIQPLEHINCFENKTLIRLARECGLEPIIPTKMNQGIAWIRHAYARYFNTYIYFRKSN